jgi:hypothetical protein
MDPQIDYFLDRLELLLRRLPRSDYIMTNGMLADLLLTAKLELKRKFPEEGHTDENRCQEED